MQAGALLRKCHFTVNLGAVAPPAICAVGFASANGIICYGAVICELCVAVWF